MLATVDRSIVVLDTEFQCLVGWSSVSVVLCGLLSPLSQQLRHVFFRHAAIRESGRQIGTYLKDL